LFLAVVVDKKMFRFETKAGQMFNMLILEVNHNELPELLHYVFRILPLIGHAEDKMQQVFVIQLYRLSDEFYTLLKRSFWYLLAGCRHVIDQKLCIDANYASIYQSKSPRKSMNGILASKGFHSIHQFAGEGPLTCPFASLRNKTPMPVGSQRTAKPRAFI
jgi:hypothetical protein